MVEPDEKPGFIDVGKGFDALRRQAFLLIAVVVASLLVGFLSYYLAPKTYMAHSALVLELANSETIEAAGNQRARQNEEGERFLQEQIEFLENIEVAAALVRARELDERIDLLGGDLDARRPSGMDEDQWLLFKRKSAAAVLESGVDVRLFPDGRGLSITFSASDPAIAAEIANAYADFAELASMPRKRPSGLEQKELRGEADDLLKSLETKQAQANALAVELGDSTQTGASRYAQSGGREATDGSVLGRAEDRRDTRRSRQNAQSRLRQLQNLSVSDPIDERVDPALADLSRERSEASAELASLRSRFREDFPPAAALSARIAEIEEEIEQRRSALIGIARRDLDAASAGERQSESSDSPVQTTDQTPEDDVEHLVSLEQDIAQDALDLSLLLDRLDANGDQGRETQLRLRKVENASIPNVRSSEGLIGALGLALLVGIGAGMLLAAIREALDDRVHWAGEAGAKIGLPLLGVTPFISPEEIGDENSFEFVSLLQSIASIRAQLPDNARVVQLTSAQGAEGVSAMAASLAELSAANSDRVLLVDANFRRPALDRLFGLELPQAGLTDILAGRKSFADCVKREVRNNLDLLTAGTCPDDPVGILSSAQLDEVITRCRQDYQTIIIDTCPLLGLADAQLVSRHADCSIMVIEAHRTPLALAREAATRLRASAANMGGLVLTKYRGRTTPAELPLQSKNEFNEQNP